MSIFEGVREPEKDNKGGNDNETETDVGREAVRQLRGRERARKSECRERQKDNGKGGARNKRIIP